MSDQIVTQPGVDPVALGVGRAIRDARHRAAISMRSLAARCGVSQPFLSEVERGISMPSIATLYKVAEALGVAPSSLLPTGGGDDVHVVRAHEGRRVRSSERPDSAVGRVVFTDETRGLEVYEYVAGPEDDLDVWFRHDGDKVLHVVSGRLQVDFDQPGRPAAVLGPGDTVIHAGSIPHRWTVDGDEPVHLLLVVARQRAGSPGSD